MGSSPPPNRLIFLTCPSRRVIQQGASDAVRLRGVEAGHPKRLCTRTLSFDRESRNTSFLVQPYRVIDERPRAEFGHIAVQRSFFALARSLEHHGGRCAVRAQGTRHAGADVGHQLAAACFEGSQRNCTVRHLAFRADAAQLARINALIGELEQASLEGSKAAGDGQPLV